MVRSLSFWAVVLSAALVAGACQSGGATTAPTAMPTAMPTAIPTPTPTEGPHGVFSPTGSMTSPRDGHTATLLANGKVLMTGGRAGQYDSYAPHATAELYDPATGSFSPTGLMASARDGHTATLLANGKVLITGGYHAGNETYASAELYNP